MIYSHLHTCVLSLEHYQKNLLFDSANESYIRFQQQFLSIYSMKLGQVEDLRVKTNIKRQREFKTAVNRQMKAYSYINPAVEEGGIVVDDEGEESTLVSQSTLLKAVDIGTRKKLFDFELKGGPFVMKPTRNGRHVVIGGKGGQLSVVDRTTMNPLCDITVNESVLDATFLHNYTMFAAAQRKCTYIYDSISGAEVHCLKDQDRVTHLDYLPFHFLLVSWAENGIIRYLDTSTGQAVAKHFSKMGPCQSLRQNMATSVVHVGHSDGCVSLWTPSIAEPVMKIRAHFGPVSALACQDQMNLITAGGEGKWKIWDLRKADKPVTAYSYVGAPPTSIDVSQSGMIAIGNGVRVRVYPSEAFRQKVNAPYLTHRVADGVNTVRFCPFEDLLLLGKNTGVASILIPGSGKGDFDSYANNPFETRNQRREGEVRALMDKLRPDMITLPFAVEAIGGVAEKVVEEPVAVKRGMGKKQLKRRALQGSEANGGLSKTDKLGQVSKEGKFDALSRFR